MMHRKIFKVELLFFLLLSLACIAYASFNLDMIDHYFSISSQSSSSKLSYYLVSTLAGIYFYIGPWVTFTCIFSFLFYYKFSSQRDSKFDSSFPIILSLGLIGVFYFVYPQLLGEWISSFLSFVKGSIVATFFIFISLVLSFSLLLMKHPWSVLKSFYKTIALTIATSIDVVRKFIQSQIAKYKIKKTQKLKDQKLQESIAKKTSTNVYDIKPEAKANLTTKLKVSPETEVIVESKPVDQSELKSKPKSEEASIVNIVTSSEQQATPDIQKVHQAEPANIGFNTDDLIATLVPEGGPKDYQHPDDIYFQGITEKLEAKIHEFKVECKIISVLKGPVVDTFEIELGSGVRVQKIKKMQDDLSLALSGAPIRVVYPMKGRTTIGIEVPRNPREVILLDEVLQTDLFSGTSAALPICMGKDAFGDVFVVDLAKMPHMLVAGATGAGKSVFINTLLVSLLVKLNHKELKLVLIDPKQLELAQYAKLPHLALPVVTEPGMASASLMWAVEEMERRYTLLKDMGVRNLKGFNDKVQRATPEQLAMIHHHYSDGAEQGYELPFVVIVIDEFADLILTKQGKEIETSVCRLAAKARAAGIHIVLATQRPSVDVITGLIKNNFPTRVSFRVTSNMDSKTILNEVGAEKLLGMGDMLYKHGVEMNRVHSAYVGEEEVDILCEKLESIPQSYSSAAMDFIEREEKAAEMEAVTSELPEMGKDALFDQAVQIVREARGASASMLQRRLRIGYNRAANLIDQLEMDGVIGPSNGSKPREILSGGE